MKYVIELLVFVEVDSTARAQAFAERAKKMAEVATLKGTRLENVIVADVRNCD